MHQRLRRILGVGLLVCLALSCFPLTLGVADTDYLGTVVITKNGYQNARASIDESATVFRAHYGERYLCVSDDGDGWYGIRLPTGDIVYVSSKPEHTMLEKGVDDTTLSFINAIFEITLDKQAEIYSQPKSTAKMRRVSGDGATESSFYYPKGTELVAFGTATRGGKDWYLFLGNNGGVPEMCWVFAELCTVTSGDPADNISVPDWWYD